MRTSGLRDQDRLSSSASWAPADWVGFTMQAVARVQADVKQRTSLDPGFWAWLDTRPDVLLSLAATSTPIHLGTWQNMARLWAESRKTACGVRF